ncbi:MAG: hypothetical protein JXN60_06055 [Lentisphaerae bacterium]|nr:hypothetical protein [Lentisphaerota bacterium]
MTRVISIVLVCIGVGVILAAGRQNTSLATNRMTQRLITAEQLENASPLTAFITVALGGFRGIIADMLWLRATHMQDAGKYFELVQLADWITKLEPYAGEIWAFHAWNMAYNVSVIMPNPEDRWRWVQHGIRLLRNEGLKYNPADAMLYRELGFIFQHKIAGTTDSAHMYYRYRWAEEMNGIIGAQPDYNAISADPNKLRILRNEHRLSLETIKEVDRLYGPLDWRLPETYAIYWAHIGSKTAEGSYLISCDRIILQTLSLTLSQGLLDFEGAAYRTRPNLAVFANAVATYERMLAKHTDKGMMASYNGFLMDAIRLFHKAENDNAARNAFEIHIRRFGKDTAYRTFEELIAAIDSKQGQ